MRSGSKTKTDSTSKDSGLPLEITVNPFALIFKLSTTAATGATEPSGGFFEAAAFVEAMVFAEGAGVTGVAGSEAVVAVRGTGTGSLSFNAPAEPPAVGVAFALGDSSFGGGTVSGEVFPFPRPISCFQFGISNARGAKPQMVRADSKTSGSDVISKSRGMRTNYNRKVLRSHVAGVQDFHGGWSSESLATKSNNQSSHQEFSIFMQSIIIELVHQLYQ